MERMMEMVELEVMQCFSGDLYTCVEVVLPAEEDCVGRCRWGTRIREGQYLVELVARNWLA